MITRQNGSRARYGLRALAVILLVLGGIVIYIGSHNFTIRAVGVAIVMACSYLVQVSNVRNRSGLPDTSSGVNHQKVKTQGRLLWIFSMCHFWPVHGTCFISMQ